MLGIVSVSLKCGSFLPGNPRYNGRVGLMPIYLRKMLVENLFEVVLFQEVKFEFGVYSDQYGYDNMELVFLTP